MKKISREGFTLVEVLVGVVLSTMILTALMGAFLAVKSVNSMSLGYLQATQIVRGSIETLRGKSFAAITTQPASQMVYDAGDDQTWGTADDLVGDLTITVQDLADFDGDGNTAETEIDVDGDNANDVAYTRPVRVSFEWNQRVLGQVKNLSVTADTLIAA